MTPRHPTARLEDPALDQAALAAARLTGDAVRALGARGAARWVAFFEPLIPVFLDGDRESLLRAARRARAAFGARDSVLDEWSTGEALLLRDRIDALQALLDRRRASDP